MAGHQHVPQAQLILFVLALQLPPQVLVGRLHVQFEVAWQVLTTQVVKESACHCARHAAVEDVCGVHDGSEEDSAHERVREDIPCEGILSVGQANLVLDHPPGCPEEGSEGSVALNRREHGMTPT